MEVEAKELAAALGRDVRGEVRFDRGSRALYATDASNYRQVPIGVVVPRDADDVLATLATCREAGVPVLGRGGGTSLAGQCCNAAVLLDFSKYMNKVVELDPERRVARVQVEAGGKAEGGTIADLETATQSRTLLLTGDGQASWCAPGHIVLRAGQELVMVVPQTGLPKVLASTQVDLAEQV
jgi:FAD/FMN-containing dehydrogenase